MITLHGNITDGTITIPASKSQTIRAFLIASFADGISTIENPLLSSDTQACIEACRTLGAKIEFNEDKTIATVDPTTLNAEEKELFINTANSGTTTYLIYGLLATLGARRITLSGDHQLNSRPIRPLVEAYRSLGVSAEIEGECPPVTITGALEGGHCSIECPTSQYLSSLLLALPLAKTNSHVLCPLLYEKPYVEITLQHLRRQGIEFWIREDLQEAKIVGGQHYHGSDVMVTGDFSSAAFFFSAAAISGKKVTVRGLDKEDPQGDKHYLDLLEELGCTVTWEGFSVTMQGPESLKCGTFDLNSMPDTLPILAVTLCAAMGRSEITNVSQARIKETDRIKCMANELKSLGADIEETPDGLVIQGKGYIEGGEAKGYGDHRIIMALAIASIIARKPVTIDDEKACSVTFPTFFRLFDFLKEHEA